MIRILSITAGLLLVYYFSRNTAMAAFVHLHAVYIIALVGVMSLMAHLVAQQGMKNKSSAYSYFMGASMFRLIFCLGIFTTYLFLYKQSREGIIWATVNFLFIYILYAVIEIVTFLSNLRRDSGHQTIL